jgi:hypothetical protein
MSVLGSMVGFGIGGDGNIFAVTVSENARISKNITLVLELRLSIMSNNFFVNKNLNSSKNLSSFMLAAVFAF